MRILAFILCCSVLAEVSPTGNSVQIGPVQPLREGIKDFFVRDGHVVMTVTVRFDEVAAKDDPELAKLWEQAKSLTDPAQRQRYINAIAIQQASKILANAANATVKGPEGIEKEGFDMKAKVDASVQRMKGFIPGEPQPEK